MTEAAVFHMNDQGSILVDSYLKNDGVRVTTEEHPVKVVPVREKESCLTGEHVRALKWAVFT